MQTDVHECVTAAWGEFYYSSSLNSQAGVDGLEYMDESIEESADVHADVHIRAHFNTLVHANLC